MTCLPAPLYDKSLKSLRRIAIAALLALPPTGVLAQNGTVAFSAQVGRNEPLTIVVFADRALLPLPERAGKISLTNEAGETIAFDTVRYGGGYAAIKLSSESRQTYTLCTGGNCRRFMVVKAGD